MNSSFRRFLLPVLLLARLVSFAQTYIPDKDFGNCGMAAVFFPVDGTVELKATKLLSDKRILLAGNFFHATSDSVSVVMVQLLPNGEIDSSGFGTNGMVFTRFQLQSYVNDIVLQPDGAIIAVGYANNSSDSQSRTPAVYRFTAGGQPDPAFNSNGFISLRFDGSSSGFLQQAVIRPDGKLLAAGLSAPVSGNGVRGIGLLQVKSDGTADSSFGNLPGSPGRSLVTMDSVSDVTICLVNNLPVVSFIKNNGADDTVMLIRFLPEGMNESGFGANGVLNTGIRSENLRCSCGNGSQEEHLLLGGTLSQAGEPKKMQVLRFTQNLEPDPVFGTHGRTVLPTIGTGDPNNVLLAIKELSNKKILVLGQRIRQGSNSPLPIVLRLLANGQPDSSFNSTGSFQIIAELSSGWNQIDSTDTTSFIVSQTPYFRVIRYVPDTTAFGSVAEAGFQATAEKQNVFFTNTSRKADQYRWIFGDGSSSEQVNPTHTYVVPGKYKVRLEAYSPCAIDNETKDVEVKGIYKITPNIGPDRGFVSTRLYGYGFTSLAKVYLKNNAATIKADTVFLDTATNSLQANFHFRGAPTGRYDVIVANCPTGVGSGCDTLPQAFEIRSREIGKPWIQISDAFKRIFFVQVGRRNNYKLNYGVTGNATQYLIPVALVVQGKGLLPALVTPIANRADTVNLPDSLKPLSNGFYHFYDQVNQDSVWVFLFYDRAVEPDVIHSLEFSVLTKTVEGKFSIKAYIGNTLFDADMADSLYSRSRTKDDFCSNKCIACLLDAGGFIPGPVGCAASILSLGCSVSNFEITPETTVGQVFDLGINFASAFVGCGTMTGDFFGKFFKVVEESLFGYFLKAGSGKITAVDCVNAAAGVAGSLSCNPPGDEDAGEYERRRAFDPNTKLGPASYNQQHYISKNEPLVYATLFENLASATAPASEVVILDTLDKAVMDLSTFRFNGITVSGVEYSNFRSKDSFAMDILIPDKGIVLRVNGWLDTLSGVAKWIFSSLDTATMALVTDPLRGFLPPNTDSISGTGAVAYSVGQKSTNTHLTSIANKATILFDFNEPITTPVWTLIVDTLQPQSQVLNSFQVLSDSTFSLRWTGMDAHSGIRNVKILVAEDTALYSVVGVYGVDSTVIKGKKGSTYKFISLARDSVDNLELLPDDAVNHPDAVFTFSASLPIRLLSFTAEKENKITRLSWETAQEFNTSQFNVEFSSDGARFTKVGGVTAAGNSADKRSYVFRHLQPVAGINYYRLQITDRDGSFQYSPVRTVVFDGGNVFVVKPNPASDKLMVSVSEPGGIMRIVNSAGRTVFEQKLVGLQNRFDIATIPSGIFFVTYVTKSNAVFRQKLVIGR